MFTSRSAIQSNTPARSGNQFFKGIEKKSAQQAGEQEQQNENAEQQTQEPKKAVTGEAESAPFFPKKTPEPGDTTSFFPPARQVGVTKGASTPSTPAANQATSPETEEINLEEAPGSEQKDVGDDKKAAQTPPELPPPPAGAHLVFSTEVNPTETPKSQAESGHKNDIRQQMDMETREARNTLDMNPQVEEGKPTILEPKNENAATGAQEPLTQSNESKELQKPLSGNSAGQPEAANSTNDNSADVATVPQELPADLNPAQLPAAESMGTNVDAVQIPEEGTTSGVEEMHALNSQPMTAVEMNSYFEREGTDADKRAEQQQFAANFATEVEAAKVRVQGRIDQHTETVQLDQQASANQLIAKMQEAIMRVNAQFGQLRSQIETQFADALSQLAVAKQSDLAAADALQIEKTAQVTDALNQRRIAFDAFLLEQQQQPYVNARKEADRADAELETAASDCLRQGNEVAARNNNGEDGDADARAAVLQLAHESADDIRAKKPAIREDVMARAGDFDGNFAQYKEDTINQINDIETQLLPAITDAITTYKQQVQVAYSNVESSLNSMRDSRIDQANQQEQQMLTQLQNSQEKGLQALEENAYNTVHGIELAGQQTITAIEQLGTHVNQVLTPSEGLPDLDAIQLLYTDCLTQLNQTETEGVQNLETIQQTGQQENSTLLSSSDQDIETVNQQTATFSAQMVAESQGQITQIISGVTTSMLQAREGITTSLDQTREEALVGLDQAIEERKSKILQANTEFAAELTSQVNTSIEKAKQPLLDVLLDRLLSAEYKARASWWEGLLLAIADFLIILIVIVAIAAILVYAGVFATIAGALMVIGAVLLAVFFVVSLIGRLAQGQGWMSILLALADVVGVTAIYQAVTNRDIYTGNNLNQSTFDRWFGGTSGVLQVLTLLTPLKNRIPGIRRITFPEMPGWTRFVTWVEGAGARRTGGVPYWEQFANWLLRRSGEPATTEPTTTEPTTTEPTTTEPTTTEPTTTEPTTTEPTTTEPTTTEPTTTEPTTTEPNQTNETPVENPPVENPPTSYDPTTRTTTELQTDLDPNPRLGETPIEAAERVRLAREELAVRQIMDIYEALGDEPQPFDVTANDAANADAHTVGNAGNPGRHGPTIPLERSLDANGLPDGTRTIEGRIYGDPPWGQRANFSGRWKSISIINRVINQYLRTNWEQIRSDLATDGNHTNAFPAGEVVGDGYYNASYGTSNPPLARGPVPTTVVRITILLLPGPPPSYYVITTFPTVSGM